MFSLAAEFSSVNTCKLYSYLHDPEMDTMTPENCIMWYYSTLTRVKNIHFKETESREKSLDRHDETRIIELVTWICKFCEMYIKNG
jgi:hypothetical protein